MTFESRQSAYEQLLEAVKNNNIAMIGLYGMGGCGKTTLAMEVRKLVEAEHCFEKVLFVSISSTVEVRRIQEKIASSLQYTFPETEVMERAQRLCLRLCQEKKILVILDDVWEKLDFGGIGIPSSEHHKGCKILITTRSEEVCTSMDCQRKIYLPILTDEEAWSLFQNKALISEGTSDALRHMGRLISKECKGLPVAIAAVASSLKGKNETIWSVALNKLRSSKPINIERGLIDPYKCLQLSYDNLDTKEAKSLFLLCSVFPEDFVIPVGHLTRYAVGLGVVGETHSYEEAKSEVIAAKIKLVSSCLLLDEDNERVKMHDTVRDVAHLIAKNENKIIKCEVKKDVIVEQNSVRYLWCVKFPNDLDCSNLEFLFLRTKLKEFDGIFKRMGMLKVLILFNDEDGITPPLSTMSLKTLTNLRCLAIFGYELSDFSFISYMKKLQSISLFSCSLPSCSELQTNVGITQVPTIKLLELNKCDIKGKKFEVMKRTPLLEELYIVDIEGEWDANSKDNIDFFNTFSVPQTLQSYGIVLGSHNFYDYNVKEFCSHHRTLLLNYFNISNEVVKSLAKKAKDLFIANIQVGTKNIIPDIFQIEGGGLDELNNFEIRDSEEIECLIDTSNHYSEVVTLFSKLHTLRIHNMENLRALWHCFQPTNGSFENLEKLYLSDCPKLTSLFAYVVARRLVQLKILKITRCDGLEHILVDDDKKEKSQGEFTTHVQTFQNLQEVKVNSCRKLKHIFLANIVRGLAQLKVLEIEECDMLDQIFGDIVPLTHHDQNEELNEIVEEDKYPHLYRTSIPSTSIVKHSPGTLSSLASLRINNCPKLGSIFTASTAKTLTSLEELIIEECSSLKHVVTHERVNQNHKENIFEDDHDFHSDISIFQSLKKLHIIGCDLLQRIFSVSFVGGMMKMNDIKSEEADDLKYFSSRNNFGESSCHQKQNNTQIELPALEVFKFDCNQGNTILDNYHVRCPSLKTLSLGIGIFIEFFMINCSTDASKARHGDYISIKISNSDFVPAVESVEYLSKQPQGLTLLIMHNIREIELKGFDKTWRMNMAKRI
ncbi:probable disease resistance protein At4g27220 isoform X1 [Phaseolus vulgaris]|uniref:probable disease resistance protein At4g27220 isoform X1 n=1 Tax=Phaseolus vulgaris TaxID=3885 RepID=UPI0035CAADC0